MAFLTLSYERLLEIATDIKRESTANVVNCVRKVICAIGYGPGSDVSGAGKQIADIFRNPDSDIAAGVPTWLSESSRAAACESLALVAGVPEVSDAWFGDSDEATEFVRMARERKLVHQNRAAATARKAVPTRHASSPPPSSSTDEDGHDNNMEDVVDLAVWRALAEDRIATIKLLAEIMIAYAPSR